MTSHSDDEPSAEPGSAEQHPARRHPSALSEFEERAHAARLDLEERATAARADIEEQLHHARAQFDATNEKIQARTGRNLLAAIGIGVLLGGAFLASLIVLKWVFILFGAALIAFTTLELAQALRQAGRTIPRIASAVVGVSIAPVAFFFGIEALWIALVAAIAVVTLWRLAELVLPSHRAPTREVLLDIGAGALVQIYVSLMAGFYLVVTGSEGGEWWTLAGIIIVVSTDIGAYAAGLSFGKHKLAPTISPGKTWEGFAGAVAAALLAGGLLAVLMLGQPWWVGLALGAVLVVVATMGDLTESMIKRDLGVKDISSWLPGHGGFLDRLDSVLPSAIVIYAFFLIFAS